MSVDIRKPLTVLRDEWSDCVACELGKRRVAVNGQFVFGEGVTKGIMFIGEGPGRNEEEQGIPFIGKSGKLLRGILTKMDLTDAYITNIVACRSCAPLTDAAGNIIQPKSYNGRPGKLKYIDQAPTKPEIAACLPRLMEEIYLVDPVVIVALGATAASALRGSSVSILKERGAAEEILVPGATTQMNLTAKGSWARKIKGELTYPIEDRKIRYLMIPTLHPSYVLRKVNDMGRDNPFQQLVNDIKQAADIYNNYMLENHGVVPGEFSAETAYELLEQLRNEEEMLQAHGVTE